MARSDGLSRGAPSAACGDVAGGLLIVQCRPASPHSAPQPSIANAEGGCALILLLQVRVLLLLPCARDRLGHGLRHDALDIDAPLFDGGGSVVEHVHQHALDILWRLAAVDKENRRRPCLSFERGRVDTVGADVKRRELEGEAFIGELSQFGVFHLLSLRERLARMLERVKAQELLELSVHERHERIESLLLLHVFRRQRVKGGSVRAA
mmetsp:Transcript_39944/g.105546  ORF Transcript_39944/g.105546 Transcript_39944/m.105546 type:complete len:209 (+) Transcript_39944:242-868(+)